MRGQYQHPFTEALSLMIILTIFAAVCIIVALHVLTMAAAAWLLGAPVEEVSIYYGKKIIRTRIGDVKLRVGFIPVGGYVKCGDAFRNVHPLKKVLIAASGCLALALVGVVALGGAEGFRALVDGFQQVVAGAFAPRTRGAGLLRAFYAYVADHSFAACVGLASAKFAALNLLPLPALNGGEIILALFNWVTTLSEKVRERIQMFGFLALVVIGLCWVVAFFYSLAR